MGLNGGSGEMNGSSMTFQVSGASTFGCMSSHRLPFIPSPDRAVNRRLPRGSIRRTTNLGYFRFQPMRGGGQDLVSWLFHLLIAGDHSGLGRVCTRYTDLTCFLCPPCVCPDLVLHKDGLVTTKKAVRVPEKI